MADQVQKRVSAAAKRYLALAEKAQKERAEMPAVDVRGMITIPQKALMQTYCPESCGEKPTKRTMFVPLKDMERYANQGYAPTLKDTGDMVQWETDVMVEIPIALWHRSPRIRKQRSDVFLGQTRKGSKAAASATKMGQEEVEICQPGTPEHAKALAGADPS